MRYREKQLSLTDAGWPYVLLATEQTKLSRQSLRQFRIQRPNIGSAPQMLEEEVIKTYRRVNTTSVLPSMVPPRCPTAQARFLYKMHSCLISSKYSQACLAV